MKGKIMEEELARLARTWLALLGISALAAASRAILSEDKRSLAGFLRGLVLAGFAGTLAGLLIQDYGFSPATQGGIVGIAAFVADDLLLMLVNVARTFRQNPQAVIDLLLRRPPK